MVISDAAPLSVSTFRRVRAALSATLLCCFCPAPHERIDRYTPVRMDTRFPCLSQQPAFYGIGRSVDELRRTRQNVYTITGAPLDVTIRRPAALRAGARPGARSLPFPRAGNRTSHGYVRCSASERVHVSGRGVFLSKLTRGVPDLTI
jgi:hypothetical protein